MAWRWFHYHALRKMIFPLAREFIPTSVPAMISGRHPPTNNFLVKTRRSWTPFIGISCSWLEDWRSIMPITTACFRHLLMPWC